MIPPYALKTFNFIEIIFITTALIPNGGLINGVGAMSQGKHLKEGVYAWSTEDILMVLFELCFVKR